MVLILKSDQRRSERWQRSWDVSKTLPKNKPECFERHKVSGKVLVDHAFDLESLLDKLSDEVDLVSKL